MSFFGVDFSAMHLNLHAFIRGFMQYAVENGTMTFAAFSDPLWHEFLLRARAELSQKYPVGEIITVSRADRTKCAGFGEISLSPWYEFHGGISGPKRIKLSGMLAENLLSRHCPGLPEELYKIAQKLDGFLYP